MRQRTSMLDVYLERVMWEACSASVAFAPRTPCKPAIQVHGIKLLSGKAASPEVLRQNHVHSVKGASCGQRGVTEEGARGHQEVTGSNQKGYVPRAGITSHSHVQLRVIYRV